VEYVEQSKEGRGKVGRVVDRSSTVPADRAQFIHSSG